MVHVARPFVFLCLSIAGLFCGVTGCNFGNSTDCHFRCNCADGGSCDPQTGQCHGDVGCRAGLPPQHDWHGFGCLTGNAAYGQPTDQAGDNTESSLAADGDTNPDEDDGSCTYIQAGWSGKAWWRVDLQGLHKIYGITIYNTADRREASNMQELSVQVSNTTASRYISCGYHESLVPAGGHADIDCRVPMVASSLRIYGAYRYMTICEVVVHAHPYEECTGCSSTCNEEYGCVDDCLLGLNQSSLCSEECTQGHYGVNCQEECGNCIMGMNSGCDVINGSCLHGCEKWWISPKCDVMIDIPKNHGENVTVLPSVTSFEVLWRQNLQVTQDMAGYYGYHVVYRIQGTDRQKSVVMVHHDPDKDKQNVTIYGLRSNTGYDVIVLQFRRWGSNSTEYGDDLATSAGTLPCLAPDVPSMVKLQLNLVERQKCGTTPFRVQWQPPANVGCDSLDRYDVQYRRQGHSQWLNHSVSGDIMATISPDFVGTYEVIITAVNNAGLRSSTDVYTVLVLDADELAARPTHITLIIVVVCLSALTLVLAIVLLVMCRRHGSYSLLPWLPRPLDASPPPTEEEQTPEPIPLVELSAARPLAPERPPDTYENMDVCTPLTAAAANHTKEGGTLRRYESLDPDDIEYTNIYDTIDS